MPLYIYIHMYIRASAVSLFFFLSADSFRVLSLVWKRLLKRDACCQCLVSTDKTDGLIGFPPLLASVPEAPRVLSAQMLSVSRLPQVGRTLRIEKKAKQKKERRGGQTEERRGIEDSSFG